MRYLLSTQSCKNFIKTKSPSLLNRIDMVGIEDVGVSSLTSYELFMMARQSKQPEQNIDATNHFLNCFQPVDFITQDSLTSAHLLDLFLGTEYSINQLDLGIFAQAINRDMLLIVDYWIDLPPGVDIKLAVWV